MADTRHVEVSISCNSWFQAFEVTRTSLAGWCETLKRRGHHVVQFSHDARQLTACGPSRLVIRSRFSGMRGEASHDGPVQLQVFTEWFPIKTAPSLADFRVLRQPAQSLSVCNVISFPSSCHSYWKITAFRVTKFLANRYSLAHDATVGNDM